MGRYEKIYIIYIMDILEIIKILRDKFAKFKFFLRVYHIENEIIIYNDVDIIIKYNLNLFNNIDRMVKIIMRDVRKKIEDKYSIANDKVSVIIPNFNNEIFLKNVISKILENTYKNIEIIIVDDKSSDKSIEIINSFENDKIKLYENKDNSGTYYSRNKGILLSNGGYILIIDGDDYIDNTYINNMVNGLKEDYVYILEICNIHFPMNVKVERENLVIKTFLGETVNRIAKILPNVKVEVKGNQIFVKSHDKDAAGQTAANIEKATEIRNRDRRIFQDGIYIIKKPGEEK